MSANANLRFGLFPRLMLGIALSVIAVVALFGWRLHLKSWRTYVAERGLALTNRANWTAELFAGEVASLRRDVVLASRLPPVQGIVRAIDGGGRDVSGRSDLSDWLARLESIFTSFAEATPALSTIQFATLADGGRELVRLDVVDGVARIVPRDSLGTVRGTEHFERARELDRGRVYLSAIERVADPADRSRRVIRAATPVFFADGRRFGLMMVEAEVGSWIDETLRRAPPGVAAYLTDEAGEDLGPGGASSAGARPLSWLAEGLGSMPPPGSSDAAGHWDSLTTAAGTLHAARTIVDLDPDTGVRRVVMAYTLEDSAVAKVLAPVRFATIVGSISTAATLIIVGGLIVAWALLPLRKLSVAAARIGEGDYSAPIPEGAVAELGAFTSAFRSMVHGIRQRDLENTRATDALRESEARFRQTLDDMQEGCQIIGFDWRYLYVNESAARHGHGAREELLGRTMMECYPGIETTPIFARLERCMKDRTTDKLENEFRYPDGVSSWFDLTIHPSRDGLFVTSYDITARKTAEIEQREASARILKQVEHLTLLDQITRAIADRHDTRSIYQAVVARVEDDLPVDFGCVLLFNEGTRRLELGAIGAAAARLDPALMDGASIEVDNNGLSRALSGVLVYENDLRDVNKPFARRLASVGCQSLVLAPLRVESRVFGMIAAARRDANAFSSTECEFLRQAAEHLALGTRQAQLHAELQEAYDNLRQSQQASMLLERMRAMSQMASGIAHDVNNSLSPVSLYAEILLQEPSLDSRTREHLEQIHRSVQAVAETISRMREFARPNDLSLQPTSINLNDIVRKVIAFTHARWSDMAQRQGVTIQMSTDLAENLPDAQGVESEIRDALTNLIFNAVDAMPDGGTITLRTKLLEKVSAKQVVLEVSDDGIGMDEETRFRCLEPFFTTKGERGTGLGLAMVFGMVQRHDAHIQIESAPGKGTTVSITFPPMIAPDEASAAAVEPILARRHLRILLVDDDPVLLRALQKMLLLDGHITTNANGGEAGINEFRQALENHTSYDIVFTDLGMPRVDGSQVAAALKKMSQGTPVVLLTGWGQRLVSDGQVPPHVDRVINKPPTLRDLREVIVALCPNGTERAT